MSTPVATRDWELWSTDCRLVLTDPDLLSNATTLIDAELARVERACSRFRPDSELMTLVRADGAPVQVSPLLAELLEAALKAALDTDGAVDPTLGSVLVGLGYDRNIHDLPADSPGLPIRISSRAEAWRTLTLRGDRLRLSAGTQLDLGATAKAVAADRCARLINDQLLLGRPDAGVLISLGGDIATAGSSPAGGWQVSVQDLPTDIPHQITLADGAAVATSSSSRRTWIQAGQMRHHLIDPRTGLPAHSPWRSVSVVAPTCLEANVATTATMVKGPDGMAWLRRTGLPARLLSHAGHSIMLGGWPQELAA